MRYDRLAFVITESRFDEDPLIVAERERLREEQGIDLGLPTGPVEEITSINGTQGRRQLFAEGEIYVRDGQAYALHGPILEHYKDWGGFQGGGLGFPVSPIEVITSSFGTKGSMMEFEGPDDSVTRFYASEKGVGAVEGWINYRYCRHESAHNGWLGLPLADIQYYSDSDIQAFEGGYFVYYFPYVGDERDWGRPPIAYPYLASHGTLLDVYADQAWQDTGVWIESGTQLTIIQVDGEWTHSESSVGPYDANGDTDEGLGGLIGKIGEGGTPCTVGRWRTLSAAEEGVLYLAMDDSHYDDNAGAITVMIETDSE
jgi:hypothetical protein